MIYAAGYQGLQSPFKSKSGMEISLEAYFDFSQAHRKHKCIYFSQLVYKHMVTFSNTLELQKSLSK